MTYKQALAYIDGLGCQGIRFGLSNTRRVLKFLGNPERKYRSIHIAGTNGKGSTAVLLSCVLKEAGYRTGLYTSPHLIDLSERIQVNGNMVSKKDIARLAGTVKNAVESLSLKLTYFEFVTVIAFLYFADIKVDIAVLETGMGGRLDATNCIRNPLVSIITNIDYDHTEFLGKKLESIAYEKAGIIKKKGIVITGESKGKALGIISKTCRKREAELLHKDRDFKATGKTGSFNYRGIGINYRGLSLGLRGNYQVNNSALVLAAIEVLNKNGYLITERHIKKGIKGASWPGRLELVEFNKGQKKVRVLLDGAHNPSGIISLAGFLKKKAIPYSELILVIGVLADKDVKLMASEIVPLADRVIIVSPQVSRALERAELEEIVNKHTGKAVVCTASTVGAGLRKACEMSRRGSLVCVAGSLYVVGEAIKYILKRK